jgi:ABC-type branched-subunit amino acid transport system substrate-binding protein
VTTRRIRRGRWVAGAATAAACLAAVACSSSGGGGGGGGSSSSGPIKLMVISPPSAPGEGNFPDGVNAAVKSFEATAAGKSHPIQVIWCNDGTFVSTAGTASNTAQCGLQAVSDHVDAVISFATFGTQYAYLDKAGIPNVGEIPESAQDFNDPLSFPLAGEPASSFAGAGLGLATNGCKSVAELASGSAATLGRYMQSMAAGIKSGGATVAGSPIYVPTTDSDFAPAVAAIDQTKADCVGVLIGPTQLGPFLTAVKQSGIPLTVGGNSSGFPPDTVKQLGSLADGMIINNDSIPNDWNTAGQKQLASDMSTYEPKAEQVVYTGQMWAAAEVFIDAVKAASANGGSVSPKSIVAALHTMTNVVTGIVPPADFSKTGPLSFAPRVSVVDCAFEKVVGGNIVSINHTLHDQAAPLIKYPLPALSQ